MGHRPRKSPSLRTDNDHVTPHTPPPATSNHPHHPGRHLSHYPSTQLPHRPVGRLDPRRSNASPDSLARSPCNGMCSSHCRRLGGSRQRIAHWPRTLPGIRSIPPDGARPHQREWTPGPSPVQRPSRLGPAGLRDQLEQGHDCNVEELTGPPLTAGEGLWLREHREGRDVRLRRRELQP